MRVCAAAADRAADLFVTCSTSETYGLTVLEALACGTPAVLPHCGVFDELWIGRMCAVLAPATHFWSMMITGRSGEGGSP